MTDITNEQKEALKVLNQRLLNLQEKILMEAIKIDLNLSTRVKNKEDALDDYEIELELRFILKENDKEFKDNDDNFLSSAFIFSASTVQIEIFIGSAA